MAEPIRIIGHQNVDGSTNEGLQAQVETDGSIRTDRLGRYKAADIDKSGDPEYYGFVDIDGAYYIMEYTVNTSIKYTKGSSGYSLAWTNRATQSYDYFNNTF